jgi:hypothetical protein
VYFASLLRSGVHCSDRVKRTFRVTVTFHIIQKPAEMVAPVIFEFSSASNSTGWRMPPFSEDYPGHHRHKAMDWGIEIRLAD